MSAVKVWLVEYDVVNQRLLQEQLSRAGCHVDVAGDSRNAWNALSNNDIWFDSSREVKHSDIILMDWEKLVMDGLTATREIRSMEELGKSNQRCEKLRYHRECKRRADSECNGTWRCEFIISFLIQLRQETV